MTNGGRRASSAREPETESRALGLLRAHLAVLGRVCMALTGDAALTERALERIAADAGAASFDNDEDVLVRLLGMARAACAVQLSKLPLRTAPPPAAASISAGARTALGTLRPTEREAVVLHLVGGLDAAGVARACGIDLETSRSRLARGLSQLTQETKR